MENKTDSFATAKSLHTQSTSTVWTLTDIFSFFSLFWLLDEEIGGSSGMNVFVGLNDFKSLNVGFALDEGMTLGASLALKGHMVPLSIIHFLFIAFIQFHQGLQTQQKHLQYFMEKGEYCVSDRISVINLLKCTLKWLQFFAVNIDFFHYYVNLGVKVTCKGSPGHGSRFIEGTAGEKMVSFGSQVVSYVAIFVSSLRGLCDKTKTAAQETI